ncbi:21608_t:CDS:2 [Gigaspora rosea]|nr:21608_t:CDS:2 [Gigaspora rosea]
MSGTPEINTEEITSSKEDTPNLKVGATENDAIDTTGMKRLALLQKENEYLMKKITEELTTWSKNNIKSAQYTVISIVISVIALLFGVILFIFEKSNYKQEVKNIISTSIIGTGGSVTLLGSLASLRNLFQQSGEGAKDFQKTLDSFNALFKEEGVKDNEDKIVQRKIKKIKELEDHLKDQKRIYIFLDALNKHMQHMSICRSISVSIISLLFIMLAIISIFYLIFNDDETIFDEIDIFLITFSAYCLFYSICVMICIQIIIPSVTEKMLDPDYLESFEKYCSTKDISEEDKFKRYSSTISLKDLLGFLSYRIYKEAWLVGIIDSIKYSILGIKSLQRKRKKESDLNKKKDLDLELKQKKLDHYESYKQDLQNIQNLKLELELVALNLVRKEIKLNKQRFERVNGDYQNLQLQPEDLEVEEMKLINRKLEIVITKLDQIIKPNESDSESDYHKQKLLEIANDEIKELNLKKQELDEKGKDVKKVEDAIEVIEKVKVAIENKSELEKVKDAIKILEKLDLKKLEELRVELKKNKLYLLKLELKEMESDLLKKELNLEQKQKLKLKLKQKALELVKLEIKSIQTKLDSEKYKKKEPKLRNIEKNELDLKLRQKKIKQELVEIKLELDQKRNSDNSDSKEIEELKSDSRHKKIELVKKEIEWTQTKLKLVKKKIESQLKPQWYIRILYFLKLDSKDENKELKEKQKNLISELESKTQELQYRNIKYYLNIDCINFLYFLFKNPNIKKLYIYDYIIYNDDDEINEFF